MSIATVQGPEKVVGYSAGQSGKQIFSVRNSSGRKMRFGLQVQCDDTVKKWVHVDTTEIPLDDNTLTEIKVVVNPANDAPPGRYSYQLSVYDADETSRSVQSEPVFFEVKEAGKKGCKWCIPAAIAAAVILVAILVFVFWPSGSDIPNIKGDLLSKAEQTLEVNGINYVIKLKTITGETQDIEKNSNLPLTVDELNPEEKLGKDETLEVIVDGKNAPDFTQMDLEMAKEFLTKIGMSYTTKLKSTSHGKIKEILNNNASIIIDQKPKPDKEFKPGEKAELILAGVKVPKVKQRTFVDAANIIQNTPGLALGKFKLKYNQDKNYHEKIISTQPSIGQVVALNTKINLYVGTTDKSVKPSDKYRSTIRDLMGRPATQWQTPGKPRDIRVK